MSKVTLFFDTSSTSPSTGVPGEESAWKVDLRGVLAPLLSSSPANRTDRVGEASLRELKALICSRRKFLTEPGRELSPVSPVLGRELLPVLGCEICAVLGRELLPVLGREICEVLGRELLPVLGREICEVLGRELLPVLGREICAVLGRELSETVLGPEP